MTPPCARRAAPPRPRPPASGVLDHREGLVDDGLVAGLGRGHRLMVRGEDGEARVAHRVRQRGELVGQDGGARRGAPGPPRRPCGGGARRAGRSHRGRRACPAIRRGGGAARTGGPAGPPPRRLRRGPRRCRPQGRPGSARGGRTGRRRGPRRPAPGRRCRWCGWSSAASASARAARPSTSGRPCRWARAAPSARVVAPPGSPAASSAAPSSVVTSASRAPSSGGTWASAWRHSRTASAGALRRRGLGRRPPGPEHGPEVATRVGARGGVVGEDGGVGVEVARPQALDGVRRPPVQRPLAGPAELGHERAPHDVVGEPVAVGRLLDDQPGAQRGVDGVEHRVAVEPGDGAGDVEVEPGAGHRRGPQQVDDRRRRGGRAAP